MLIEALVHLPSGYQGLGEAEAEIGVGLEAHSVGAIVKSDERGEPGEVFHAAGYLSMSSQVKTRVTSINVTTISATVVAFT